MPKRHAESQTVPPNVQVRFDTVVRLIDAFCREHLNTEYASLCRKMTVVLFQKRPCPLTRGNPAAWAAGIASVVGRANFLDDPSQHPHMKIGDIGPKFDVGTSTAAAKAKKVRELIPTGPLEMEWQLPSRLKDHPLAWMIEVNGFLTDARHAPREVQEEAFRLGLIPFLPSKEAPDKD